MIVGRGSERDSNLIVEENWTEELKRLVPDQ